MYVWWPGITKDIASTVHNCVECQMHQSTPPVAPLHPWSWPTRPWARLHSDYAGPFEGKMILIIVDAHSKWIEAICTPGSTFTVVIDELRTLLAQFGLPETIVTDNGPCFVSSEFETFLVRNGIKHLTSAPYHPSSNGLAERAVQLVKRGLKKITRGSMKNRLAQILFHFRLIPQTTTGVAPSELLLGRRPRSRLDLLKPHTAERVEKKQSQQKEQHDLRSRERPLEVGTNVFVRNYHHGNRWLPGVIEQKTGPVSFKVRLESGRIRRCHQDQVRNRSVEVSQESHTELGTTAPDTGSSEPSTTSTESPTTDSEAANETATLNKTPPEPTDKAADNSPTETARTYPKRSRNPVDRFEPTW